MSDEEIRWVTPDELTQAARRLSELIKANDPRTRPILLAYDKGEIGGESLEIEIDRDLREVSLLAKYAKENGVTRMTVSVNW